MATDSGARKLATVPQAEEPDTFATCGLTTNSEPLNCPRCYGAGYEVVRGSGARRLAADGQGDEATRVFREALLRARTENQRETAAVELADLLFDLKEWVEAAKYYEGIITTEADLPRLRAYAVLLFNAGKYTEALAFAREVRKDGDAIPVITEVKRMFSSTSISHRMARRHRNSSATRKATRS